MDSVADIARVVITSARRALLRQLEDNLFLTRYDTGYTSLSHCISIGNYCQGLWLEIGYRPKYPLDTGLIACLARRHASDGRHV